MKRVVSAILLAILLTSMLYSAFKIMPAEAAGTIYIRADGSIDPPTAPISRDGDTYTLTGNVSDGAIVVERDNVVVDGAGYTLQGPESGTGIDLSGRSNVTIKSMTIKAFYYGISLDYYSDYNSISGNNITNNGFGIRLDSSSGSSISGNNITANKDGGIWLSSSSNSSISGNNITNNGGGGIVLEYSSNSSISGNTFTNDGLYVWGSYQNSVENNTVNGRPLVYLEDVSNYTVDDAGQVILVRCDNIRAEGLNLSRTSFGVELWETSDSTISGNSIANNVHGIVLHHSPSNNISGNNITDNDYGGGIGLDSSSNSSISGNTITANNEDGIVLSSSSNSSISGNNITNNGGGGIVLHHSPSNNISGNNITENNGGGIYLYFSSNCSISGNNIAANNGGGILLEFSSNNSIFHNNFINAQQAYSSDSVNVWDDGYPSGGNYWSDYTGTDADHDGIGDTPYVIDGLNQDNYPLMQPFTKIQIPGDINNDGTVDIFDIVIVALEFGHPPPPIVDPRADVNKDGLVDIFDIVVVALHFGETG